MTAIAARPRVLRPRLKRGDSYTKLCRIRPKPHKVHFAMAARTHIDINPFILLMHFGEGYPAGGRSFSGTAGRGASRRQSAHPKRSSSTWPPSMRLLPASGYDRTGHQLHARATGVGDGIHRAGYCCCQRRYWRSLDPQCAKASLSRLGRNERRSQLQLARLHS